MKGGIADTCAYGSEAHDSLSVGLEDAPAKKRVKRRASEGRDPSESASDVVEGDARRQPDQAAQERLEQLERDIAVLQQHASIQVPEPKDQIEFLTRSPDLKGVSGPSPVMGMLKGRSYGTHFYGASSATSVIAHVSVTAVDMLATSIHLNLSTANEPSSLIFAPS
jgi:aminoglycoside phosphotransferase (APT) family kinase protein